MPYSSRRRRASRHHTELKYGGGPIVPRAVGLVNLPLIAFITRRQAILVVFGRGTKRIPVSQKARIECPLHRDAGKVVWRVHPWVLEGASSLIQPSVRQDCDEGDKCRQPPNADVGGR